MAKKGKKGRKTQGANGSVESLTALSSTDLPLADELKVATEMKEALSNATLTNVSAEFPVETVTESNVRSNAGKLITETLGETKDQITAAGKDVQKAVAMPDLTMAKDTMINQISTEKISSQATTMMTSTTTMVTKTMTSNATKTQLIDGEMSQQSQSIQKTLSEKTDQFIKTGVTEANVMQQHVSKSIGSTQKTGIDKSIEFQSSSKETTKVISETLSSLGVQSKEVLSSATETTKAIPVSKSEASSTKTTKAISKAHSTFDAKSKEVLSNATETTKAIPDNLSSFVVKSKEVLTSATKTTKEIPEIFPSLGARSQKALSSPTVTTKAMSDPYLSLGAKKVLSDGADDDQPLGMTLNEIKSRSNESLTNEQTKKAVAGEVAKNKESNSKFESAKTDAKGKLAAVGAAVSTAAASVFGGKNANATPEVSEVKNVTLTTNEKIGQSLSPSNRVYNKIETTTTSTVTKALEKETGRPATDIKKALPPPPPVPDLPLPDAPKNTSTKTTTDTVKTTSEVNYFMPGTGSTPAVSYVAKPTPLENLPPLANDRAVYSNAGIPPTTKEVQIAKVAASSKGKAPMNPKETIIEMETVKVVKTESKQPKTTVEEDLSFSSEIYSQLLDHLSSTRLSNHSSTSVSPPAPPNKSWLDLAPVATTTSKVAHPTTTKMTTTTQKSTIATSGRMNQENRASTAPTRIPPKNTATTKAAPSGHRVLSHSKHSSLSSFTNGSSIDYSSDRINVMLAQKYRAEDPHREVQRERRAAWWSHEKNLPRSEEKTNTFLFLFYYGDFCDVP